MNELKGEQWTPFTTHSLTSLRIPIEGSLRNLSIRHQAFLARVGPKGFTPPPPLSIYAVADYRRPEDPVGRPWEVFSLVKVDETGFRAFDPCRQGLTVAGMLRYATKQTAIRSGWEVEKVSRVVLGHGEPHGAAHYAPGTRRFAYIPLPSIEARGGGRETVGSIRRVILMSFSSDMDEELAWARNTLPAQELVEEHSGNPIALLSNRGSESNVVRRYVTASSSWVTVTPVVLPGFDDPNHLRRKAASPDTTAEQQKVLLGRLADRIDGLIRKAMLQAGLTQALTDSAIVEWRHLGFIAGVGPAQRYGVPSHLKRYARYHVRLQFRTIEGRDADYPGPLCIGSGRFYGLGLFAAESVSDS